MLSKRWVINVKKENGYYELRTDDNFKGIYGRIYEIKLENRKSFRKKWFVDIKSWYSWGGK